MEKGICNVSVAPLRAENSHQSEMVSQLLYGEKVEIIEENGSFSKIKMDFDAYEGWVDAKQISKISEDEFDQKTSRILTEDFEIFNFKEGKILLSIGSEIPTDEEKPLLEATHQSVSQTALRFLNVPYLWSGRSFFGIDCSGFTQIVFKVHGIQLPRDAHQQAEIGQVLDFVEESEPGDLAFFENQEGKISHVGIMLEEQKIIHAYGKVRIDLLDSTGIFNKDLAKHTHKLRFVKRIL